MNASSLLASFEAKLAQAHAALESSPPILTQIDTSLRLCEELACDMPFDVYTEMHSKAMSFFGVLARDFQENGNKYTKDDIFDAFYHAMRCPMVIPRLYVGFILACCDPSEELVKLVSKMLACVCHPMRGFMLRFTAISFYPSNFASLEDFVVENFKSMFELAPLFVKAYPVAEDAACGWLAANISIGFFFSERKDATVRTFMELAIENRKEQSLALNIVSAVVQTVSNQEVLDMFPLIVKFFDGMEPTDKVVKAAGFCCQRSKSPIDVYKFVVDSPFEKGLCSKVLQMCIECKDMDTLKMCLQRWPTEQHFIQALNAIGNETFAEICQPLDRQFENVLIAFIENADAATAGLVVDMIRQVRTDHGADFEHSLNAMITRVDMCGVPLQKLFEEPFTFTTAPLFDSVMQRLKSADTPLSSLIEIFKRSPSVDPSVRTAILCLIWNESETCDTLFSLIDEPMTTDANLAKLIRILPIVSPNEDQIGFIFDKCHGKKSLLAFLDFITAHQQTPLLNKTLQLVLSIDETIPEISRRLSLYMKALQYVPRVPDTVDPSLIATTITIIETTLAQTSKFPHFPIAPTEKLTQWRDTITSLSQLAEFADPLTRIASLLCL